MIIIIIDAFADNNAHASAVAIERRFAESKLEIARAKQGQTFAAFVVNDDLARATDEISAIVAARLQGGPAGKSP